MENIIQKLFFMLIVRPFFIGFIGLRVYGKENIPRKHPFIIIANHSSHLDAATILSLFPLKELINIRPVAAADYFNRNKLTSLLSKKFFNILPIPRKDVSRKNNPLNIMKAALDSEQSIIVFPEGTRSSDGQMSRFRPGVAHLIRDYPNIPVIPIYLSNLWRSLPKGEYIPLPLFLEVSIGKPLHPQGNKNEIVDSLQKAISDISNSLSSQEDNNDR
jgi:1-acyl-sn-glycerol-3-phosphate acyltransferase